MRKYFFLIFLLIIPIALAGSFYVPQPGYSNTLFNVSNETTGIHRVDLSNTYPYNSLVAYWAFDQDIGTTLIDYTSNNNNGLYYLGATYINSGCKYQSCASLDGSNDYIDASTGASLKVQDGNYTLSMWYYPKNTSKLQAVLTKGRDATSTVYGANWGVWQNASGFVYMTAQNETCNGGVETTRYNATASVTQNEWVHILATKNSTHFAMYKNGVLANVSPLTTANHCNNSVRATIGSSYDNTPIQWNFALMDEVMIFNDSLNSSQITDIYNNQTARFYNAGEVLDVPNHYPADQIESITGNFSMPYDTNVSQRIAYWNNSNGYNDTTSSNSNSTNGNIVVGKIGNALFVNGSQYAIVSNASALNMTNKNFTVMSWVKHSNLSAADGGIIGKWQSVAAATDNERYQWVLKFETDTNDIKFATGDGSVKVAESSANTLLQDTWTHVVGVSNGTHIKVYINGARNGTVTAAGMPTTSASHQLTEIGTDNQISATPELWYGYLDEMRVWERVLTDTEISNIYSNESIGQVDSAMDRMSLVAEYTFNESSNNELRGYADDTGQDNNAQYVNMTIQYNDLNYGLVAYYHADNVTDNDNVVSGQVGNALTFDGSNDYVTIPHDIRISPQTELTVNAWIYPNNVAGGSTTTPQTAGGDTIFSKYQNSIGGYIFFIAANKLSTYNFENGTSAKIATSTDNLQNQTWQMVTMVRNNTNTSVYINGTYQGSVASVGNLNQSLVAGAIGANIYSTTAYTTFNGTIDQVRVWNRTLTQEELTDLYNNESLGVNYTTLNRTYLQGEWIFLENATSLWASMTPDTSGNNNHGTEIGMFGANISDSSGNGNNGLVTGGTSLINAGKYNQTFSFNGASSYINASNDTSTNLNSDFTLAAWVKRNSIGSYHIIMARREGSANYPYSFYIANTNVLTLYANNGSDVGVAGAVTIPANLWTHVAVSKSNTGAVQFYVNGIADGVPKAHLIGNKTTSNLLIGVQYQTSLGSYFNGSIDEVMIYNRTLTATDIALLYTKGRANWNYTDYKSFANFTSNPQLQDAGYTNTTNLLAYYKVDNVTGNNNVVTGQVSNALSFDGVDDYVTLTNLGVITNATTVMGWVKVNNNDLGDLFGHFNQIAGGNYWWDITINGAANYPFTVSRSNSFTYPAFSIGYNNATAQTLINDGNWHHIAMTSNGSTWTLYFEGVNVTKTTISGTPDGALGCHADVGCSRMGIGGNQGTGGTTYFNGSVDQFRLFNRNLSATEIANIFSNESAGQVDPNMNRSGILMEYVMNETNTSLFASTVVDSSPFSRNTYMVGAVGANISDNSGNGYNALAKNGLNLLTPGKYNQTMSFNTSASITTITTLPATTGAATFCAWTYALGYGGGNLGRIFDRQASMLFYIASTNSLYTLNAGATTISSATSSAVLNTWKHVCVARDSSSVAQIYVDAIPSGAPGTVSGDFFSGNFYLGNEVGLTRGWNGSLDDVMLWDRQLSTQEISDLYIRGRQENRSQTFFDTPSATTWRREILMNASSYSFYTPWFQFHPYICDSGNLSTTCLITHQYNLANLENIVGNNIIMANNTVNTALGILKTLGTSATTINIVTNDTLLLDNNSVINASAVSCSSGTCVTGSTLYLYSDNLTINSSRVLSWGGFQTGNSNGYRAGNGGTIYINANRFTDTNLSYISASGGGLSGTTSNRVHGGNGGTVYLYVNNNTQVNGNITSNGGLSTDSNCIVGTYGEQGDTGIFVFNNSNYNLTVNGLIETNVLPAVFCNDGVFYDSIIITPKLDVRGRLYVTGIFNISEIIVNGTFGNVLTDKSVPNHAHLGGRLTLNSNILNVTQTGEITSSGQGLVGIGSNNVYSGAGNNLTINTNYLYLDGHIESDAGSPLVMAGSRGNGQNGGIVLVNVTNNAVINGNVTAYGGSGTTSGCVAPPTNFYGNRGNGGNINITSPNNITLLGIVTSQGGITGSCTALGSGGINYIKANKLNVSNIVNAARGTGTTAADGNITLEFSNNMNIGSSVTPDAYIIRNTTYGRYKSLVNITENSSILYGDAIKIAYNNISINQTQYPQLDTSAELWIYNLSLSNNTPYMDGMTCDGTICTFIEEVPYTQEAINYTHPYASDSGIVACYINSQNDSCGTNNGTLAGGANWSMTNRETVGNLTAGFDGVDDRITLLDSSKISPENNTFSISLWMKTSKNYSAAEGTIYIDYGSNTNATVAITINTDNKAKFLVRDLNSSIINLINNGSLINDNNWHHIVGVRTSKTESALYLDGLWIAGNSNATLGNISTHTGNIPSIGNNNLNSVNYFNGSLDEIAIYNISLTPTQISTIYNNSRQNYNILSYTRKMNVTGWNGLTYYQFLQAVISGICNQIGETCYIDCGVNITSTSNFNASAIVFNGTMPELTHSYITAAITNYTDFRIPATNCWVHRE